MKEQHETLLALTCLGIGHLKTVSFNKIDWDSVQQLANEHGLLAVVLDGIEKLPDNKKPPQNILLNWIGGVMQNYEQRYVAYENAIASLARFHREHSFKMMILKGYACSKDWPRPNHRPCGDIDIWQFGQHKNADKAISSEKGIEIDNSHHHHTVYSWDGFTVENHYDFINTHAHKSGKLLDRMFKEMGMEDSRVIDINGERIYSPNLNMNALFLLRHSMAHFAAQGINLRQLLDWAFFVEKHHKGIDWEWLEAVLDEYGMKILYHVFNAICVFDLGFDVNIFTSVQFDPVLKDRVLNEILSPAVPNNKPNLFFDRVLWKYRRWRANEWKHKLCYNESMWGTFWCGVWAKVLKPASI